MKILLIEDDVNIQRITKLVVEKSGHQVLQAELGADGIAMSRTSSPDVILLDYNLPDFDGPTILKELLSHETTRAIPVIFLTAIAGSGEDAAFLRMGARGLISKPFKATTLLAEIGKVLAHS